MTTEPPLTEIPTGRAAAAAEPPADAAVVDRRALVAALEEVAELLELQGENPFKVRAYTNGARVLEDLREDPVAVVREGRHVGLRGIGEALAKKLSELVATGRLAYLERLRTEVPRGLRDWLRIPGLGPKRARTIHQALGVGTLAELEDACHANRVAGLPGIGARLQEQILDGIARLQTRLGRFHVHRAWAEAEALLERLRPLPGLARVDVAGSLRRCNETVGDIDLVAATDDPARVHEAFVSSPGVVEVIGRGPTKSTVRLASGLHADLRTVAPAQYPFLLHHLTGSAAHNTALRGRARARSLKLNEYGLFHEDGRAVPATSEEELFRALGLAWIPPELREDLGEIEAAAEGALPSLVELGDLRGVLHVHSTWSDGRSSIRELAAAAREAGWEYLAVCDHSAGAAYAGGLEPERLRAQHAEIDAENAALAPTGFRILKGTETDILREGTLDYDDELLAACDVVVASVHSHFRLDAEAMTQRVIRAVRHPRVHVLGHATGRLLLGRDGYALDVERVLQAAAEEGVVVELNADPYRLDLDWRHCRRARELGVRVAIDPDAHRAGALHNVRWGVGAARKAGLTRADVVNCLPADALLAVLRAAHGGATP